ncbi:MAG: type VI secretion system accessory protein TagJ [Thiohalocapsa sp.]
MDAEQALREGNIDAALKDLQSQIRKAPADPKLRVFLFQLLAVLGQWNKALNQLNVAAELDAAILAMVGTYRDALPAEVLRSSIFAGKRDPLVFGEPQQWIAQLVEALRVAGLGQSEQSDALRSDALELAPVTSGQIDGEPFAWIADADTRLGPVLEAVLNGRYIWLPFQHMHSIRFEAPADLRDLVWAPAQITWANGGESVALIPARYPDSETNADARIRLSRRTEWEERSATLLVGLGQRMLATDRGEYPLLGIREVRLDTQTEADPGTNSDG